jgi:hypothetical protein
MQPQLENRHEGDVVEFHRLADKLLVLANVVNVGSLVLAIGALAHALA